MMTNSNQFFQITPIPFLSDNYAWALRDGKSALIVDPGEAGPIRNFLKKENLRLSHILITHHHADHCGGAVALKKEFGGCIIGPDDARVKGCDDLVQGEENRILFDLPMKVLFAPGHTRTHVLYYFPTLKALFTGDTLFSSGCGRLFEGSPEDMLGSLTKCIALPDDTKIYCGHEYTEDNLAFAMTVDPANTAIVNRLAEVKNLRGQGLASVPSTLAMEKTYNPFLRTNDSAIRNTLAMASANDATVFAKLREMKNRF